MGHSSRVSAFVVLSYAVAGTALTDLTDPHARTAWLRVEMRTMQRLHGLSMMDARDRAKRKLFLMDVAAADDLAALRSLLAQLAAQVVWR